VKFFIFPLTSPFIRPKLEEREEREAYVVSWTQNLFSFRLSGLKWPGAWNFNPITFMNTDLEKRTKALELAVSQINRQFGKGAIMKLGEEEVVENIPVIPTGCLSLDLALGVGGVPRGRIIEIYGTEASGKTTLALHIAAEAQKQGGTVAFIDAEHALDAKYARRLGVQTDELLISQPDNGEQALEIADVLVRSGAIDLVIIDSVAALVPKAELEGDMGDAQMGLQARLMSQAMRKLAAVINKSRTTVIFINQIREKIGILFGNNETTTGGRALKFYASQRLEVRKMTAIKQGQDVIGSRTKVKVVKNKVAPPFKEAEFDILYGEGISSEGDILDLATNLGIIVKSGAWYAYNGERIGQGREVAKAYLKEHPEVSQLVTQQVRERWSLAKPRGSKLAPAVGSGEGLATEEEGSSELVSLPEDDSLSAMVEA